MTFRSPRHANSVHFRLQPLAEHDPLHHQSSQLDGFAGVFLCDALQDGDFITDHSHQICDIAGVARAQVAGQRSAAKDDALVGFVCGHGGMKQQPSGLVNGLRALGIALGFSALLATPTYAFKEHEVQTRYCAGMPIDQHLDDGSEVDCLSPQGLAIEVDFTDHWAQAIGQSLHYARVLKTRPAVILVCNSGRAANVCERHLERMIDTLVYWNVGILVWYCRSETDRTLADCRFIDAYESGNFQP